MENKVMKIFTVNKFYAFFVIIMVSFIVTEKNILDVAYLAMMTYYYIKFKLHQREMR